MGLVTVMASGDSYPLDLSHILSCKNRVNYILESFANEILKLISVIELNTMLFGRTEEERNTLSQ